jgi:hypothetical protein
MHIAHLQKRITSMKALLDVSTPVTDNRLADEDDDEQLGLRLKKSMQVVDDHPLSTSKSVDSVFSDGPGIDNTITSSYQLRREIDSVSIDWRSLRNIKECVCSTPFDHSSKKVSQYFHSMPIHHRWQLIFSFLYGNSHTVGDAEKCFVQDVSTSRPPYRATLLIGPCPSADLVIEKFDSLRHPSLPLNGWGRSQKKREKKRSILQQYRLSFSFSSLREKREAATDLFMIERRCFDTIYLFFFSFLLSYYYILSFTNEGSLLIYILFFSVLFWGEFLKKKVGYFVCVHIPLCTLMFLSSALSHPFI